VKYRIVLLFIFRLFLNVILAQAQDAPAPTPLPDFTKAEPAYTVHYQCAEGREACIHHGGIEWFELGEHNGNVYIEVFGGAQVFGVFDGNLRRLDVDIENHIGFFYEGTRFAYITGIPLEYDRILIGLSIPGYGHADFGAT
jgi:hypothetical protein